MPLPELDLPHQTGGWPPDPLGAPAYYRDITARRIVAYVVDAWMIALILGGIYLLLLMATAATFGLLLFLHPLLAPLPVLVALAYHSLQTAGPHGATLGMRLCGLRVYDLDGGAPTLPRTLLHTACFYGTLVPSGGLLLLIALFNPLRRTLHDMAAGLVVLRKIGI